MRSLFDPLFNLIRGRLTPEEFTETSNRLVEAIYADYFGDGYKRWAVLGLLTLMQPDKNYHVDMHDFHTELSAHGDIGAGMREEAVDEAVESNKLAFESSSLCAFMVPSVLMHSTRLKRYVAIHPDFTAAHWKARNKSEHMEWLSIKDIKSEYGTSRMWPDLFIYTAASARELNLVADYHYVARPDLIVEINAEDGWYEKGGLECPPPPGELKPRLGCYIICRTRRPRRPTTSLCPSRR